MGFISAVDAQTWPPEYTGPTRHWSIAVAVALRSVLSSNPAQELPLPGVYTGDETWFEAVSLRPPLSFLK